MSPTPFLAQRYLAGLCYPTRKERVVEAARRRGADARLLRLLRALPGERFETPIALAAAIGDAR